MKIAHLSDTQMRSFKRLKEYRDAYEILYASVKSQNPDVIVIAGDIVHNKLNISTELMDILGDYFLELSKITELRIIPGNHDLSLNNLTRMDALSPIIKALNKKNIHYHKYSGVYSSSYKDFDFVVFSCVDEGNWPKENQINKLKTNIGLFHGMIQGAVLQNGETVELAPYKLRQFLSLCDYLMLGDIHEKQFLDVEKRAAYCGSFPQQNYAETINKGYLVWDIKDKHTHSVDFLELKNVCPFYTIDLKDDLDIDKDLDFNKKSRIKIKSREITAFEKKKIEDYLKLKFEPVELIFAENETVANSIKIIEDSDIENIDGEETQERLIANFVKNSLNANDEIVEKVLEINKKYHVLTSTEQETSRNLKYKVKKITFDNLFSFGESNVFDYSSKKGLIGIFGNNGRGKSSVAVDIPLYAMFNRISKEGVVKNDLLINEKKDACAASLELELNDELHCISRATQTYIKSGKHAGDPVYQGKTDVDYKIYKKDGSIEEKNGEERATTDKEIRKTFGTIDDLMSTSIAPQWKLLGIVNAGSTDRQKLIGRYFDIEIFEKKNKLCKEDWKEIKTKMKMFSGRNFPEEKLNNTTKLLDLKKKMLILNQEILAHQEEIKSLEKTIERKEVQIEKFLDKTQFFKNKEKSLLQQISNLEVKISSLSSYVCIKNSDCCILEELSEKKKEKDSISKELELNAKEIEDSLNKKKLYLEKYFKSDNENKLEEWNKNLSLLMKNLQQASQERGYLIAEHEKIKKDSETLEEIKKEYEVYEYFIKATSKDGISKQIISRNLDIINIQIDKILQGAVPFSIKLESADDGKAIEILFNHANNAKSRRIEITSGMEKTIAALAIRVALIQITTLPKANILVLDEPFGALDAEYKDAVCKIMENIKPLFDSIFLITHDDYLKEIVDCVVEIDRDESGFSIIK